MELHPSCTNPSIQRQWILWDLVGQDCWLCLCHRHWNIHSCRFDCVSGTGAFLSPGLTLSLTLELHICRVDSVNDTGAPYMQGWQCQWHWSAIYAGLTVSMTLKLHIWRVDSVSDMRRISKTAEFTVSLNWSIHSCRVDGVNDHGASFPAGLTVSVTMEHP